ncbi:hypothetical protein ACSSZE_07315 [Acidithiobacillus caldus]|uniref:Lysozyme inhibitor LprI N-terminal domain-containing protein n=1 Tax=Acidithiobacillus caldus TaxID=33059 RepID=A0A1E7YNH3_9PROT|nr:hypothetical protein BAE27_06825 [Acidithiobacillus caldus]OFC38363.1 hypothetical protein BAE28_05795 [Acidithiobacillus caldus]OFC40391.1 hypothetical protein BAE29_05410 [Acidithiobacillus caldus]OFC58360.1 hypothetical protein BAE30_09180 [Acidithiobacillus caldus]
MGYRKVHLCLLGLGMLFLGYAGTVQATDRVSVRETAPLSPAVISRTGFSWWRDFARERRYFRQEALHCVMGQHERACWAGLSAQLRRRAWEGWTPQREICIGVQRDAYRYWHDLAKYAALSGRARISDQNRKVLRPIDRRLQRVERDLRSMADVGRCPENGP